MATLRRDLGLTEAITVVVGTMVGSGIFLGPERIARLLHDPTLVVLVWIVTGGLILLAALTYGELGALFPTSGGDYQYLKEAYGPATGFFNGWSIMLFGKGASLAAVAVGASVYATNFLPLTDLGAKTFAVGLIAVLATVNVLGVRHGGRLGNALTAAKLLGLVALVVGGLLYAGPTPPAHAANDVPTGADLVAAFGVAMVPALFAYDGWSVSTQVADEIREPKRNLPRSLVVSVVLVALVYVAANVAYLRVLGVDGVGRSPFAAADVAGVLAGGAGRVAMTVVVLLSIIGTANAITVTGPRVSYAMGRDGFLPKAFARVSRYGTPANAIVAQATFAALLAVAFDFNFLLNALIFAAWIFYGLAGASVIVLRRARPAAPRAYRVPLYPWVPLGFVALAVFFVANELTQIPVESGIGLVLLALGGPVYLWARARRRTVVGAWSWRRKTNGAHAEK